MLTKRILFLILCLISFSLLAGTHPAPQFNLPPDHQSTYLIEKFGTDVGEMRNQLHYDNGTIRYISTATAKGLAALFISADPKETSILSWPERNSQSLPQMQRYAYFQKKKHKKNQQMLFSYHDENKIQIEGSYKKKNYHIESEQPVWTRQFLPLLISSDLQQNPDIISNSYLISNKGRIQKYTYTLEGHEMLEFQNRSLPVIKFKITKKGSRRMSYVWLSEAHYYLPLKIEQYKDGDINGRLLMTNLKLNNPKLNNHD